MKLQKNLLLISEKSSLDHTDGYFSKNQFFKLFSNFLVDSYKKRFCANLIKK